MTGKRILGTSKKDYAIRLLGVMIVLLVLAGVMLTHPKQPIHAAGSPGNWTTYLWDNGRSDFNSTEKILNPGTASQLKLHWQYHAGGTINTQVMVVNGTLYWGSWDGYEHAMDLTGKELWRTYLGKVSLSYCQPSSAGVASTATVSTVPINGTPTQVIFVGGGDAHFYALNASNGHIIWNTSLGRAPRQWIWDAPAVYNGSVYIGVSSYGDCPNVAGQLFQMNVATGTIQHTFSVPCAGGGIWGSPTIDEANKTIYAATGNGGCKESFSLVKLNVSDLSLIDYWEVPVPIGDSDFGSTPTLFQATINGAVHQMVGVVNKYGTYYAFDRSHISAGPVWKLQVSSGLNNISPSAWDGKTLYIAATVSTVNGQQCGGSVSAVNPANGTYLWRYCAPSKVIDAVTLVPGLVIAGAGSRLIVLAAQSGKLLFSYRDPTPGATFYGAASVSNGVLYIGDQGSNLFAFTTR